MVQNRLIDQEAAIAPEAATPQPGMVAATPLLVRHGFAAGEAMFRAHFAEQHAAGSGSYNDYRPVYRYGYDLGKDGRYRRTDWRVVEHAARPPWEARNPGTWAHFQAKIRFAWETARLAD